MEWRDRARHVVSAAVTVRPVAPFSIDLSYELRMRRRMPMVGADGEMWCNLKDENRLNAGLAYRISDAFTVFARGENLLNCRSLLMPFVPSQGITGLVGVGVKF
jgi:outer membrane cobalamin receptor